MVLAVAPISSFSLAVFRSPGTPPNVLWGSYPVVEKDDLENYSFCHYCSKPKSPRTHHCRSCGMCALDMEQWELCWCKHFILFLISAIVRTVYVSIMVVYSVLHMSVHELVAYVGTRFGWSLSKKIIHAILRSTTLLSIRWFLSSNWIDPISMPTNMVFYEGKLI